MAMTDDQTFAGQFRALVIEGDVPDVARALDYSTDFAVVSDVTWRNLVTNNGRAQMTKIIVAETTSVAFAIGLSTSAVVPALGDTALVNEIYRQNISVRQSFLTYSQRYVSVYTTNSFGSTGLAGAGLFDTATTGGVMWADASISVSKSTTQTLIADWRITATTG